MCGCAHRGMKPRRCSDHCRMTRCGSSCAGLTKKTGWWRRARSGPLWVHEIKHGGYRLMVRRDGLRVRCFTRNGNNWADTLTGLWRGSFT